MDHPFVPPTMKLRYALIGLLLLAACAKQTTKRVEEMPLPQPEDVLRYRGGFNTYPYAPFTKSWKMYTSPDQSFSLRYPDIGSVSDENWGNMKRIDVFIDDEVDLNQAVSITRIEKNAVTMEEVMRNQERDPSVDVSLRTELDFHGVAATRIDIAPKQGPYGTVFVFIPRDGYYLMIRAPYVGSAYQDFLTEAIMSTMSAK
jgi:hypothetical protein